MKKAVNLLLAVLLTQCVLSVNVMANGPDNVSKHDITVRYVVNTDPELNVPEEKTVFKGEIFDPLEGVSATDEEDGDLTNKVSFSKDFNLNEKGTYTITYTVTDRFGGKAIKTLKLNVIDKITEGNTSGEATLKENAPVEKVEAEIKSDAIVDSIVREGAESKSDLTADQKEAIKSGADVKLELVVDKSNPTAEETSKIEKAVKNKDSNTQIGTFLDVNLLCIVTQNNSQVGSTKKVKETDTAVKVSVTVPDTLVNNDSSVNRKYDVARLHNGTVELLGATYDAASKKLTFSTDRFSIYAIVYTDTKVEQAPVYIPNKKKPVVNTGYGFDTSVIDISGGNGYATINIADIKESEVYDVDLSVSELELKSKYSDSDDTVKTEISFNSPRITANGDYKINVSLKDATAKPVPGVYEASFTVTVTYNEFEARIGDRYYSTLQKAIDAANTGDEVRLLKSITVSDLYSPDINGEADSTIVIARKGITLDGGNHVVTIDSTVGKKYLLTINNTTEDVVIKDIEFVGSTESKTNINITGCSNVIIENVKSSGGGCSAVVNNSSVTIDGKNTKLENGSWNYAVNIANGSTYNPQVPSLTVNNGDIGTLYFEKAGSGLINGGNINTVHAADSSTGSIVIKAGEIVTVGGKNTIHVEGGIYTNNPAEFVNQTIYGIVSEKGTYRIVVKWSTVGDTSWYDNGSDTDFTISSVEEFAGFANLVSDGITFAGKTVKLGCDIDLSGKLWTPIGQTGATQFLGTFDGGNHTISNLKINNTDESVHCSTGLFGWLNNATVKNLKIDGATVSGHHNVGVIAGYLESEGCTIEDCHVLNAIISCTSVNDDANGDKCGGIVGHAGNAGVSVIECSVVNSTISAGRDAGQVVGAALEVNVTGCSASNVTVSANGTSTGANIRNEVIGRILN